MFTFKEFLKEMEDVEDVEDMSSEDLIKRSIALRKKAALKQSGREDQADKGSLRELQVQLRQAKDPRQKADLQRRIRELTTKKPEEGM